MGFACGFSGFGLCFAGRKQNNIGVFDIRESDAAVIFEGFAQSLSVGAYSVNSPRTENVMFVRVAADKSNFRICFYGQRTVIFHEYAASKCRFECRFEMLRRLADFCRKIGVVIFNGVLEKSEVVFQLENTQTRVIDKLFGNSSVHDKLFKLRKIGE